MKALACGRNANWELLLNNLKERMTRPEKK